MQYIIIYMFVLLHDRKVKYPVLTNYTYILFLILSLFDRSFSGDVGV